MVVGSVTTSKSLLLGNKLWLPVHNEN